MFSKVFRARHFNPHSTDPHFSEFRHYADGLPLVLASVVHPRAVQVALQAGPTSLERLARCIELAILVVEEVWGPVDSWFSDTTPGFKTDPNGDTMMTYSSHSGSTVVVAREWEGGLEVRYYSNHGKDEESPWKGLEVHNWVFEELDPRQQDTHCWSEEERRAKLAPLMSTH